MDVDFDREREASRTNSAWPGKAILAFTRLELGLFRSLRPDGQRRGRLFGITELTAWPDLILAGPILGAPQAAMVLEQLGRNGVTDFLSLGWCGALQPTLRWGDLVLPVDAVSEEGTSPLYAASGPHPTADPQLRALLAAELDRRGQPCTAGRVWTTDAPYRETRDKVVRHAADGVLAVDMETSALMAVAAFRKLRWAGLMVVSDELWGEAWRPGFRSPELKRGLETAASVIMTVSA